MPGVPTGHAAEPRLALTRFGCNVPADRALLRRVGSVDLDDSACSFVFQSGKQRTPTRREDAPVQSGLGADIPARSVAGTSGRAGHGPYVQPLDTDLVEPAGQVGGGLFHPIGAPVLATRLQPGNRSYDSLAPVRSRLSSRQPALLAHHAFRLFESELGTLEQFARRERGRHNDTPIDAYCCAVVRRFDRLGNRSEGDVPPADAVASDSVRPYAVRHGAAAAEFDPTDLRHPHVSKSAIEPGNMLRLHTNLPKPFVNTCLPPRRPLVRAPQEVGQRLVEIPQGLLLHGHRPRPKPVKRPAGLGELVRLLKIVRSRPPAGPPVQMLLDRQVPHESCVGAVLHHHHLLGGCGQKPESWHEADAIGLPRQDRWRCVRSGDRLPWSRAGESLRRLEAI